MAVNCSPGVEEHKPHPPAAVGQPFHEQRVLREAAAEAKPHPSPRHQEPLETHGYGGMRVWTRGRVDGKQGDHFLLRGKPSDEHCTIRELLPPTFNPTSKDGATALKRPKVTVVKATAAKAGRLLKAAEEKGQLIYVISIHYLCYFHTLFQYFETYDDTQ